MDEAAISEAVARRRNGVPAKIAGVIGFVFGWAIALTPGAVIGAAIVLLWQWIAKH